MGLDMYLKAEKYLGAYEFCPEEERTAAQKVLEAIGMTGALSPDCPSLTVGVNVAYWRKVNAVHRWFVDTFADGVDDCKPVYVPREGLETLLGLCKDVLNRPNDAPHELPTQSGFFFGSVEYDEYYLGDLRDTVEQLTKILADEALRGCSFYYEASW